MATDETQDKGRHIASHAAIRGIAAAMVVVYHLREGALYLQPRLPHPPAMERWYLLVDVFFILSGFVITYAAAPDGKPLDRAQILRFWRARAARIYPLHLFCTALLLTIAAAGALNALRRGDALDPMWSPAGLGWVLQEAALVHSLGLPGFRFLNPVSWSLSAEMGAYLLFPALLAVAARRGGTWLLLGLSVGFYAFILIEGRTLQIAYGLAPLRCLAAFVVGLAICLDRSLWARLSGRACDVLMATGAAGFALALATNLHDVLAIPFAALAVAAAWPDRGKIAAFLARPSLQYLGEISFSLYLMHWVSLIVVTNLWMHGVSRLGLPYWAEQTGWIAAVVLLSLPAAALTHRFIERPAQHRFRQARRAGTSAGLRPAPLARGSGG
ncbi:acyltransferase [Novosphingobium sp. TCA1]|uniref:acyltransferase family protein n=1 Tax=Novosphingobium sp. TCA1 TaxID=2682474 RepID=UPI001309F021|nr:acyltransferase [Novosphingobium sp. TCA1]GFE75035.1 acyltransferase [Novosphingobium sp. TCA1]